MRKLNYESYEEIKRTVVEMLIYCNCLFYPIDPFVIAKALGIHLHTYAELKERGEELSYKYSIDGYSSYKNELEWHIYYNEKMPPARIRFTIMHEIGHFQLGHIKIGTNNETEEAEANYFAKYALAPSVIIHKNLYPCVNPERIQNMFLISKEASVYAYSLYLKWLKKFKETGYKSYEIKLLEKTKIAA